MIVVDERGVAERTQFRHATSRWKMLSRTALSGVAILPLECVEAAVRTQTPDRIARWIERAWMESGRDAIEQLPEEPDLPAIEQPAYLRRAVALLGR